MFDWADLPAWLDQRIDRDRESLTREQTPEQTLALRARIKLMREIRRLPDQEPMVVEREEYGR